MRARDAGIKSGHDEPGTATLLLVVVAFLIAVLPARAGSADATQPVAAEQGAGFGRVVLELPSSKARYRLKRQGDHVLVESREMRTAESFIATPRNVLSVSGESGRADIVVAPGVQIRSRRVGSRILIDVLDPPPAAKPGKADTRKPANAEPAPGAGRTKGRESAPAPEPRAAPAESKPSADPTPVAQAPAPKPVIVSGPPQPDGAQGAAPVPAVPAPEPSRPGPPGSGPVSLMARLVPSPPGAWAFSVPFETNIGAAGFRLGDTVLIVFDERRPIDLGGLRAHPILAATTVQMLPEATLIRLPLPQGADITLTRGPDAWIVASGQREPPAAPIRVRVDDGRLILPADTPGRVVTVLDPASGNNVLIGTQLQPGQSVPAGRRTPEFALLPSWQGVAIEPLSDGLALSSQKEGFVLSALGGKLALAGAAASADALAESRSLTRLYDFSPLPVPELMTRMQAQVSAAGSAPPLARGRKRQEAAETMIALGLGAEAQSELLLAAAEDAREAEDARAQGLLAIAALLAGRPEEAGALADPRLTGSDEIALWRAVKDAAGEEGSPAAASVFAATAPLVLAYPSPLRDRLLPLVAETMAAAGEIAGAEKLITNREDDAPLALARAMLLEAKHDEDAALAAYDALWGSRDRLIRARSALRAVELRLATGRIDARAGADAIDRLLYSWRGDQRELGLRLRLAALRADGGEWRPALSLLRETERLFPDQRAHIHQRMQETFAALLRNGNAGQLPPLELVTVVEDNADVVPDGKAGEELATAVADRLVALDLPARAGAALNKLMQNGPPGPVRARFGARLAALRLGEHDPSGALAALADSAAQGLTAPLAEERTLLSARAHAERGATAEAVAELAALDTEAADQARASILEAAKDWAAAERALADYAARTVPPEGALTDDQRRTLLRLASAAAQAGDTEQLASLGRREAARMEGGAFGDTFRLLTADPVRGIADLPRAGKETKLARGVTAELKGMGQNGAGSH
ncbi:MAG: hypothetical protein JOZ58_08390 [Acetobacteraceae bacterium]|nr:hypothetical protein [Acetobacteraceae bacterium]